MCESFLCKTLCKWKGTRQCKQIALSAACFEARRCSCVVNSRTVTLCLFCTTSVCVQYLLEKNQLNTTCLLFLFTIVTWLILPVVICSSQRLSHACVSISIIQSETANGSLNQLLFTWSYNLPRWISVVILELIHEKMFDLSRVEEQYLLEQKPTIQRRIIVTVRIA